MKPLWEDMTLYDWDERSFYAEEKKAYVSEESSDEEVELAVESRRNEFRRAFFAGLDEFENGV